MGVPALWRILRMGSKEISLNEIMGVRLAVDIHSYLNRIMHSNNPTTWVVILLKHLFTLLQYNIKIIIVFPGKKPNIKGLITFLGDENEYTLYRRIRSAIQRTSNVLKEGRNNNNENQTNIISSNIDEEPSSELPQFIPVNKPMPREVQDNCPFTSAEKFSEEQFLHIPIARSNPSHPTHMNIDKRIKILIEEDTQPVNDTENIQESVNDESSTKEEEESETNIPKKQYSFFSDIISDPDLSSDGNSGFSGHSQQNEEEDEVSLEPSENAFLNPTSNYITAEHIRIVHKLCNFLNISVVYAPEEAAAECAYLEQLGVVDGVASDDNNAILFGANWLIRSIFYRPVSYTMKSLTEIGITRLRLINIAIMIEGDYNLDISKRLFTVGPVRGLEIISNFPDEKNGLHQFKDWYIKVIKNKQKEKNKELLHFSKHKWLSKLILPAIFPSQELYDAFIHPAVADKEVSILPLSKNLSELQKYVISVSSVKPEIIQEYVEHFGKRMREISQENIHFVPKNKINIVKGFANSLEKIQKYDLKHPISKEIIIGGQKVISPEPQSFNNQNLTAEPKKNIKLQPNDQTFSKEDSSNSGEDSWEEVE